MLSPADEGVGRMLAVWGRKTSPNVQALMWCIGELGLPFRRHDAGCRYGGIDTPAFPADESEWKRCLF